MKQKIRIMNGRIENGARALVAIIVVALSVLVSPVAEAQFPSANPAYQTGFPVTVNGTQITSSVALGDVSGNTILDIVVGGADGKVHAYTGTGVKLWEFATQSGEWIVAKPAIGDIDGDGFSEVVVGVGSTFTVGDGGVWVIDHLGQEQCHFVTGDLDDGDGRPDGVHSSPALADLDGNDGGRLEIIFGSWDKHVRALNDDCSIFWETFQIPPMSLASYFFDSIWSSPAIGDVNKDGQLDVVIGCDSPDASPNVVPVGGALHVLDGATGQPIAGFPQTIDEVIWSSPALGDLTANGQLDMVVGTGNCWEVPACSVPPAGVQMVDEAFFAWDRNGNALTGWPFDLKTSGNNMQGTYAFASPALADLDGDTFLEVILNTKERTDAEGGQIYALNPDGSQVPGWPTRPVLPATPTTTISLDTANSPVVADIDGDGDLEVILPSNWDLVVFDKNGNQLSRNTFPTVSGDFELATNGPIGGSAAVGDIDGDGDLEVVGASYAILSPAAGGIYAWDFPGTDSAEATPWPAFRRTADNNGRFGALPIFSDGFESGNISAWN